MKPSKPRSSSAIKPASQVKPSLLPPRIGSVRDLRQFQRVMSEALFRPLNARDGLQAAWSDGRSTASVAADFVKPTRGLSSVERLEIYARSYWFRVLDCLYDDYPGVRAILGQRRFMKLATAFLAEFPSASFSLRNLGGRLPRFIQDQPAFSAPRTALVADMARFEWAQVVAFDGPSLPALTQDDVLDAGPSLRVALQPHITVLECGYPVDEFALALKKTALRTEASNALTAMPDSRPAARPRLPRPARTCVAVHRQANDLYFKRLDSEAYSLLIALRAGRTLTAACAVALRDADPAIDWASRIRDWFRVWQSLGWFCRRTSRGRT
jgi:hypothetical protein